MKAHKPNFFLRGCIPSRGRTGSATFVINDHNDGIISSYHGTKYCYCHHNCHHYQCRDCHGDCLPPATYKNNQNPNPNGSILVKDKFINGLKDTAQKRWILEQKNQDDPLDSLIDNAQKFEDGNELIKPAAPTFASSTGKANNINSSNNFAGGRQNKLGPRFTNKNRRFFRCPNKPPTRIGYRRNFNMT